MLICTLSDGIYEGSILLVSKEVEDRTVEDIIKMVITMAKVDIILSEVGIIRTTVKDYAQMYKLIENLEAGNLVLNGSVWKSKVFVTVKETFMTVLQSSKIPEMYDQHQKVLDNFVRMNKWSEGQEHIGCGWVEDFNKHVRVKIKFTKRNQKYLEQRLTIFKTKAKIVNECSKNNTNGKKNYFIRKLGLKYQNRSKFKKSDYLMIDIVQI